MGWPRSVNFEVDLGRLLALPAGMTAGGLIALQAQVNGSLSKSTGSSALASGVSFAGGLTLLFAILIVLRRPTLARFVQTGIRPWWLVGGVTAAVLVTAISAAAPVIGVTMVVLSIVGGQMVGSLVADRLGLGPGGAQDLTAGRVSGAVLAVIALGISAGGAGRFEPILIGAMAAVGFAMPFGMAGNGHLRELFGDSLAASLVNFGVAFVLVAGWLSVLLASGHLETSASSIELWMLLGGPLGAVWVAATAGLVRRLGLLQLYLASTAGQLAVGLALDLIVPVSGTEIGFVRLLAAATMLVAVAVAAKGKVLLVGNRTPSCRR